jgi:ABC-type transport system involved in multi-copper enzyme maturation permease subunit
MTKTFALLLDSYRELNAKRLFWISIAISGLVVAGFAMIGLQNDTITILAWKTPLRSDLLTYLDPAALYKSMFTYFGVGFWLTWIGNILALASTAGIFPDFLAAGSVDLYLSKPLSRLRLFLSKFVGGLLFVGLQVSVFSLCSFFVLGLRGHEWNAAIFLSIPLVLLVFSYLFSICVLLGVLTRSTVTALLVTLLVWFCLWGVQATESFLLLHSIESDVHAATLDRQIADTKAELARLAARPPATSAATSGSDAPKAPSDSINPFRYFIHDEDEPRDRLVRLQTERQSITDSLRIAHGYAYAAVTILPKTSGTTELLVRALSSKEDAEAADAMDEDRDHRPGRRRSPAERRAVRTAMKENEDKRTATWFIGTSLGFELVMVGAAAWVFCRRDY